MFVSKTKLEWRIQLRSTEEVPDKAPCDDRVTDDPFFYRALLFSLRRHKCLGLSLKVGHVVLLLNWVINVVIRLLL